MTLTSAPKNTFTQTLQNTHAKADQPADQQERISYGEIVDVDPETSQIIVKMYRDKEHGGDFIILDGAPISVIQPLSFIHQVYGALSKGMKVRIFWIGKHQPKSATVEVIGDASFDLKRAITQEPEANRVDTQPYVALSGGLTTV